MCKIVNRSHIIFIVCSVAANQQWHNHAMHLVQTTFRHPPQEPQNKIRCEQSVSFWRDYEVICGEWCQVPPPLFPFCYQLSGVKYLWNMNGKFWPSKCVTQYITWNKPVWQPVQNKSQPVSICHQKLTYTIASTPRQYRSHIVLNLGCPPISQTCKWIKSHCHLYQSHYGFFNTFGVNDLKSGIQYNCFWTRESISLLGV